MTEGPSTDAPREKRMREIGLALVEVLRTAEDTRASYARRGNLHPTDFGCIGLLTRAGRPLSPKEIITYLGLSSGSGTALLDRLETAGYIKRLPNPDDRRGVLIALDEEAAKVPIALYRKLHQRYEDATASFTDRDLSVIADFLERVARLSSDEDAEVTQA